MLTVHPTLQLSPVLTTVLQVCAVTIVDGKVHFKSKYITARHRDIEASVRHCPSSLLALAPLLLTLLLPPPASLW